MVARSVAFVVVAMASKMKKIQFVYQTVALEEFEGAIHGDARNFGVDGLSLLEDFGCVHVAISGFDYSNHDAALARETNTTRAQFTLKFASGFVNVDTFAGGDAVCGGRRHLKAQYSKMRREWLGGFGYW